MNTEVSVQYITGAPSTRETPNSEHVSMGTISLKYISHYYTPICISVHLKSPNPFVIEIHDQFNIKHLYKLRKVEEKCFENTFVIVECCTGISCIPHK